MTHERGTVRMATGLILLLGVAGRADQAPLTPSLFPLAAGSLLLGLWGVSRAQHGPTLPRLARWWTGLPVRMTVGPALRSVMLWSHPLFPARRRHALIYARAARR